MTAPTRYDLSAGVATITLDAATNRNAFSQALLQSLAGHLRDAHLSEDARSLPT